MVSRSKRVGSYHENFFVKLFKSWNLKVKKQPLSGSLGGEYSGDLVLNLNGEDYIVEVKYRKKDGFPNPFTVLDQRDIALYKRGNGEPKWLLIVPDHIVKKLWSKE